MTIHKIYYCKQCNTAVKDEAECLVCGRAQAEIGWVEIEEKGEQDGYILDVSSRINSIPVWKKPVNLGFPWLHDRLASNDRLSLAWDKIKDLGKKSSLG
jgi:hypothetical protein